jgi:hypothetical protein
MKGRNPLAVFAVVAWTLFLALLPVAGIVWIVRGLVG